MLVSGKKVATLSPVAWRTPPRRYGAWETVASDITEGLVSRGWDVTLLATGYSKTPARLRAVVETAYEEDSTADAKVLEYPHISAAFENAAEFDLILLGWIHPDKGVHLAIAVARLTGRPLVIAGIIQDQVYFREQVEPHIDNRAVRYVGPVDVPCENALFARARALLHLNTIPERFGLVLAEANAAGVPVIAMNLGSCSEVIEEGQTGFLVTTVDEAAQAVEGVGEIDRAACRERVQRYFSIDSMVEAYERVYSTIFELEAGRRP